MLRKELILAVSCLLFAAVAAGADGPQDGRDAVAPSDQRDSWFRRGLSALFSRRQPDEDAALGAEPQLDRQRFLQFAGWRIDRIHVLGREAFGEVDPDGDGFLSAAPAGGVRTRTGPFERLLNSLAVPTREGILRNFLLFREHDLLVPAALADSERLLRQEPYIRDVLIVVLPLPEKPQAVDVVVLVRDRWPWGVQASVKSARRQQATLFHRNVAGLGWNLEAEISHDRRQDPVDGWRTRLQGSNLGGTFVDVQLDRQWGWDRDLTIVAAQRQLRHADIRLLGGWSLADETLQAGPALAAGERLQSRVHDAWFGWNVRLRAEARPESRRPRLIPAVRLQDVDFREPVPTGDRGSRPWRDHRRYLLQLHLVDLDYYTTSLVYGYGETEDLPAGFLAFLVGGLETGDAPDRPYHGLRVVRSALTAGGRFLALDAAAGGFRRRGRLEDGVLDLGLTTISPLQRRSYGAWRHFLQLRYTLGVDPADPSGLRLDAAALRDLDEPGLAGAQRLVGGLESVLFTPLAVSGFKLAAFGYADGGAVAPPDEPLGRQRLHANAGLGLRLNNPNLVLPTIELRLGALMGRDGWQPAATVRMGEATFGQWSLPGARPGLLPYR